MRILLTALVCLLALTGCGTAPAPEAPDTPPWGLTLGTEDVTATGLTLVCTQSGEGPSGELQTGSWFRLEVQKNGQWTAVDSLFPEEELAWTAEAWGIPTGGTARYPVDWTWLYGALPPGCYRITKEVMDFRGTGDYDTQEFWAEFAIVDE